MQIPKEWLPKLQVEPSIGIQIYQKLLQKHLNGMLLSNHSYGIPLGSSSTWNVGSYNSEAQDWDKVAYAAPYYLPVLSAGNDGGNNNAEPILAGYDKLVGNKVSKNALIVANASDANINSATGELISAVISGGSSEGPADDGRIKPDISGNGTSLYSTWSSGGYGSLSGTSMAAPNVTGSLVLVQQHYNNINNRFMKAETLKALALHTADDLGRPGPDAIYGWGYMNAKACVETINNNGQSAYITEAMLNDGDTYTYNVNASGTEPLKVSVVWTDPAGNWVNDTDQIVNNTRAALVNDLDVRVTEGSNTFFPWKLSTANVAANATRNSDNLVDNVESVLVDNPTASPYTITINHKGTLTNDQQKFAIVVTGLTSNFTLQEVEVASTICDTNDAIFNFNYKQFGAGTTSFTALNMPTGMTASFNNSTLSADGILTATFGNLSAVTPGEYNIQVEGANGTDVERRNVFIKVYSSSLVNTVITNPVNGAASENVDLTLNWNSDFNALSYLVEVATDVTFNDIVFTENTTSLESILTNLTQGQVYYARIYPSNNCGTSTEATFINFQIGQSNCLTYNGSGFNIPDEATVNSTIDIPDNFIISDVNLNINYTHTYIGDLAFLLESPDGTNLLAINSATCSNEANANFKFDDVGNDIDCPTANTNYPTLYTIKPVQAFSAYNGESPQGIWNLQAIDGGPADVGDVNSWSIEVCETVSVIPPNLIRNNAITIAPLSEHIYNNTNDLEIVSSSETANQQIFTVIELPTLGDLLLNNTTLNLR